MFALLEILHCNRTEVTTPRLLSFRSLLLSCAVCAGFASRQRQRTSADRRGALARAPVRTYASMETGQGSSTVTVSPPEILAGKEVQPSAPKAILRTDYRPTPYLVSDVHLTFLLGETTRVKSKLSFVPNYPGSPPALALDGRATAKSMSCSEQPQFAAHLHRSLATLQLHCSWHRPKIRLLLSGDTNSKRLYMSAVDLSGSEAVCS